MKTRHLFWGVLFITLGIFILINRFYGLTFTWEGIWKLWPLVLILWGAGFIINKPAVKMIITGLTAFFLAFALFGTFSYGHWVVNKGFYFTTDDYNDKDSSFATDNYKVGFDKKIKEAEFNFSAGAGTFVISNETKELFSAETQGPSNNYSLNSKDNGDKTRIDFEMKKTKIHLGENKLRNRVEMNFNPDINYNLKFDIGAASGEFDFSGIKAEKIDLNTGAASLNIKLGDKLTESHMTLDAGAASVDIQVPETSGCEIKSDVSLSSKDYLGFTKINENLYRTDNFDKSSKKIFMEIKGGVSSIKVSRSNSNEWK